MIAVMLDFLGTKFMISFDFWTFDLFWSLILFDLIFFDSFWFFDLWKMILETSGCWFWCSQLLLFSNALFVVTKNSNGKSHDTKVDKAFCHSLFSPGKNFKKNWLPSTINVKYSNLKYLRTKLFFKRRIESPTSASTLQTIQVLKVLCREVP